MKISSLQEIPTRNVSPSSERLGAWEAIGELRTSRSLKEVSNALKRYCGRYGFDNFGFARRGRSSSADSFTAILDFPDEWAKRYDGLATSTTQSTDPVIRHVTKAVIPTTWDCTGRVSFTDPSIAKSARPLLGAAGEHNLRAGITIPLFSQETAWSFLVLTLDGTADANDLFPELPWACLIAQSVQQTVRNLVPVRNSATHWLTRKESEVIRWCAAGKTSWEIGQILNISESTVNFHLANTARRFGVRGRFSACAAAIAEGLVDL